MKYFIDKDNNVYAYEADGSQDSYIKEGLTAISHEEAMAISSKSLETPEQAVERIKQRKSDYENEADPLYFKAQRGEATMEEWLAKVDEIKNRYLEG